MNDELEKTAETALDHLKAGRFPEAATAFERLLADDPDRGEHWHHYAFALHGLRRYEDALDACRNALARGVADPARVHINRAAIYADNLARPEPARAELEAALAIAPDSFPALVSLGGVYEDLGDKQAARETYEKAQAIEPEDIFVLTRLAALTGIEDADHPLVQRMEALLEDPALAPAHKSGLGFSLGQVLDSLGRYDEAFAAYRAGNRAARAERGRIPYNPLLEAQFTGRIIKAFPVPEPRAAEAGEEKPIFVCGMFRSGSTLAERILARHSRVTPGGELELILAMVEGAFSNYPEEAAAADDRKIEELRSFYLAEIENIRPGADLVTDKQTFNFRHIGLIKRLFPGARIIDTLRNPRDNGLAIYFANLGPGAAYALELPHIVHFYGEYRRIMAHWQALYPDDIHTLDYDALVADPEPHIRGLVDFCGLDWEDACLEPHKASTAVRTASAWQVRQPLYKSSSGRWRNYEKHIAPLIEAFPDT